MQADFSRALGDANQHDIHDAHAAHERADGGHRAQQVGQHIDSKYANKSRCLAQNEQVPCVSFAGMCA